MEYTRYAKDKNFQIHLPDETDDTSDHPHESSAASRHGRRDISTTIGTCRIAWIGTHATAYDYGSGLGDDHRGGRGD